MKGLIGALGMLLFALPLQAAVYHPQIHRLDNGLEVIVIENHRAPLVIHMMCFKAGTNDSPWGKSGMAHYLEHLMFKGNPDSAAGSILRKITQLGGSLNAQTTSEYTFYYEIIPAAHLETAIKLDAERMSKLEIDDQWAKPEINVILEERHMRVDNTVAGKFTEEMNAIDIRHHPSRLPTIGWAHEIRNYTTKDAQDFYRQWYAPNNAFVVIGGDVSFAEAKRLAEKYYGSVSAKTLPPRLDIREPRGYEVPQTFEMTSALIESPLYVRRYPAPTFNEGETEKFYALIVLKTLLNRPVTGRLTESLIEKQHLAVQVSTDYMGLQTGPGRLQITLVPPPESSLVKLENALAIELKKLVEEGVTELEVENTKSYILSDLVYTQDDITEAAQKMASLYASGMPIREIEAWPERIKAVTAKHVNKMLSEIFTHPQSVIGRLLPVKFKPGGASAK